MNTTETYVSCRDESFEVSGRDELASATGGVLTVPGADVDPRRLASPAVEAIDSKVHDAYRRHDDTLPNPGRHQVCTI